MGAKRALYQQVTILKLEWATGFAWEVRFSETVNGKGIRKTLIFPSDTHPAEASVRKATQTQVPWQTVTTNVPRWGQRSAQSLPSIDATICRRCGTAHRT